MKTENFKIRVSESLVAQALCAEQALEKTRIGVHDAAKLVKELSEMGHTKKLSRLRTIFQIGCETLAQERQTPTFDEAYSYFLNAKPHLRERTKRDYRAVRSAILKHFPEMISRRIHLFDTRACAGIFDSAFRTPRQRHNARAILHAFFSYCDRHAWCPKNPVSAIDFPVLKEREITPLSLTEISAIFRATKNLNLSECLPAIALMLFAGIRPREVERLCWDAVDWEEKVISIAPTHSKTGGIRHVSLSPALEKILQRHRAANDETARICPPNWCRKWERIRRSAGWNRPENPWQQDVLRHTFASYHLKFFKNLTQLQCEMGHATTRLLRTRYLSMRGVTANSATRFWGGEF